MYRGSAAIDSPHMYIYVSPKDSHDVYRYTIQEDEWIQLQNCPYVNGALVMKNNFLLCVGGRTSDSYPYVPTNQLFRLQGEEWKEHFPSMNTARYSCAAITVSHYLLVIGGYRQSGDRIASVEMLDSQTKKWSHLTDLPRPLPRPSATICGNQVYVLSWGNEGGYCSPIAELLTSSGSRPALTWTPIPQPPVYASTIATLSGVPVLVGGAVRGIGTYSSTVYSLSHGQWVECGHLCEARSVCLVASLTTSHMLVMGGRDSTGHDSATVELCSTSVV